MNASPLVNKASDHVTLCKYEAAVTVYTLTLVYKRPPSPIPESPLCLVDVSLSSAVNRLYEYDHSTRLEANWKRLKFL